MNSLGNLKKHLRQPHPLRTVKSFAKTKSEAKNIVNKILLFGKKKTESLEKN